MADTSRGSNVRDKGQDLASTARQTAQEAKQTAQETASNLGQKAQDVASNVAERARDFASTAQDRAESAVSTVGQQMSNLGGTLRQNAPQEGFIGTAATTVADQLQQGGRYLQQHGLGDMADDLSALIRQHPMPALLCAFGFGWFLGMASRR
jgi:cell division septum initiation protein DivIVA